MNSLSNLSKLYELKTKGVITEAEYEEQKKRILENPNVDYSTSSLQSKTYIRSRNIYILLAYFLGAFGVHNFYAGRTARGIGQIVCLLFFWLIIPIFALFVWIFIDMLTIKTDGTNQDMIPLNGWGILLICLQAFGWIIGSLILFSGIFTGLMSSL